MTIKELRAIRPDIADRAVKNQIAPNKPNEYLSVDDNREDGNFDWDTTVEGFDYWNAVRLKDFAEADRILKEKGLDKDDDPLVGIDITPTFTDRGKITIPCDDYEKLTSELASLKKENEELKEKEDAYDNAFKRGYARGYFDATKEARETVAALNRKFSSLLKKEDK